ncbi:fungal pheromone STE3G-protein-coupled receptor [Obba rivulosa]|uniref:Fungal pheromone STE3G-protein-coupled receptor n=1 Tax=Obba rivulosa TaxID=1052685 RepID=A0A8E2AXL2_9APHY|nr:fungal pheromone STE3G-protein-coupled receptor [Obba rivulosa]
MQLFQQVQTIPVGAFIGAAVVLIPLPSHWRARNVATLSIIAWLFVIDMIYGINALVWRNNIEVRLVVWCDITTKIIIGSSSALPAATLCICKYLESVAATRIVRMSKQDKRRQMRFELALCFGVPFFFMALHYVVQGHRFDIIESFGCQPATYISIPGVFVVWFPPLILATGTLIYASLALYHFFMQRLTFTLHLQNINSALTTGRYLRLIAMSVTEILWGTTLTALVMAENIVGGLRPWTNWNDVHSNFSRIGRFALLQYPPYYLQLMILFAWAIPASSIIFFLFFGFSEDVMGDYKRGLVWFRRKVLRQTVNEKTSLSDLPTR